MNETSVGTLRGGKRELFLSVVVGSVLVLAMGAGIAYASDANSAAQDQLAGAEQNIVKEVWADGELVSSTTTSGFLADDEGIEVSASVQQDEHGTVTYSTDGGKTWSEEIPEDFPAQLDFEISTGDGATGVIGN